MQPIDIDAFEAMVADALATVPDDLRAEMETSRSSLTTRVRPVRCLASTKASH